MVTLEKRSAEFVEFDEQGELVRVDWEGLACFSEECGYSDRRVFGRVMDNIIDLLKEKEKLTHEYKKGSFAVIAESVVGANVGPLYSVAGITYNFIRREDAEDYLSFATKFHRGVGGIHLVQILS